MKTIKLFNFIKVSLLVILATSCESVESSSSKKKPNVIIVITDDQGYGDLGHTGNQIIKTPGVDKFATESISLTNYHVGTTCAPTRAGLLTGRNCNRNGVWHTIMGASMLNREEVTIANVFQDNGYKTGMFGKWHLGDNHPFAPEDRGFDETFYHGGGGVGQTPDYWNNDYFDDTYFRNGIPEKVKGYCTDVWFDEALQFIEKKKDDNFLCYLSLNAPHSPYNVPNKYYDIYKEETEISNSQKRFYGMITNIDENFSKLLEKLEELKIADNTIVIYTTDNGTSNGYKYDKKSNKILGYNAGMRGAKASEYDGGHRVPFIIRWPNGKIEGGTSLSSLTAHVDILPTLASLVNINFTPKKEMDGTDISDYLLGKGQIKERFLVTDTQRVPWPQKGKQSCVMQDEWRLIKGKELYNVTRDPGQINDIALLYPSRVDKMNDFYEKWWTRVSKEIKFSTIDLGVDIQEVITCHDARTIDFLPPWNQRMIRQGKTMKPAPFFVNFTNSGTYTFKLSRWPIESGLALGDDISDERSGTKAIDPRIHGEPMQFKRAHLKIGNQEVSIEVDNEKEAAVFELNIPQGKTELLAYFDLENEVQSNAFYITVEKVK